jgi:hypothetical protein
VVGIAMNQRHLPEKKLVEIAINQRHLPEKLVQLASQPVTSNRNKLISTSPATQNPPPIFNMSFLLMIKQKANLKCFNNELSFSCFNYEL